MLDAFEPGGPIASADSAFRPRPTQRHMALAVADAIEQVQSLVVEAGTGIGKTYAYLVPVLLSGRRALVSTATRALQDQLFLRDLPRLVKWLRRPVRMSLLKGRSSYLCLQRLEQARAQARLPDRASVALLARIERWSQATASGDLAEVDGLHEGSALIPLVTSTRDNCLGSECPKWSSCHLVRARREAMAADVVVVNHHLFFADVALRDSGVAELLPTVDVAVFDEAHHLVDVGLQFLGTVLGTSQIVDFARDLAETGQARARGLQPWADITAQIAADAADLRRLAQAGVASSRLPAKLGWAQRGDPSGWAPVLTKLGRSLEQAAQAIERLDDGSPEMRRLAERASALVELCARFSEDAALGHVRWIDLSAHSARLVESPLDIRRCMSACREASQKTWVFTSATLGDDERLSWFTTGAGVEDAKILRVQSPFDYPAQARFWVPRGFPAPREVEHPTEVGRLAADLAIALTGRTFVLTTSVRVLSPIAQALTDALMRAGGTWQVLVQGQAPRRALLERFGDGERSVLLGSQGFWEGIDVPGQALQCVVIDKLPFPMPTDPLTQARVQQVEARGGRAFEECFLAEAAVSLKQGAGRLIRTESDRGLLVVCDPRLGSMPYGRRLRSAVPPMSVIDTREQALQWLRQLAGRPDGPLSDDWVEA
ncbi:MAG: ATP-dependent DNA helicase [Rubrivivax sp.]